MNIKNIKYIKSKVDDGAVEITFADGEKIKAILISVSETERDVIFEMLSTDRPEKYRNYKSNLMRSPFSDIVSVV